MLFLLPFACLLVSACFSVLYGQADFLGQLIRAFNRLMRK